MEPSLPNAVPQPSLNCIWAIERISDVIYMRYIFSMFIFVCILTLQSRKILKWLKGDLAKNYQIWSIESRKFQCVKLISASLKMHLRVFWLVCKYVCMYSKGSWKTVSKKIQVKSRDIFHEVADCILIFFK